MATRIYAIPDAEGIIRIACGSDEIEIFVVPPGGNPPWNPDRESGSDIPYPAIRKGLPIREDDDGFSPLDEPYIVYVEPKRGAKRQKLDIDSIAGKVRYVINSRYHTNPKGLVVAPRGAIDLHEMTKLSNDIGIKWNDFSIGVDFGDAWKDE